MLATIIALCITGGLAFWGLGEYERSEVFHPTPFHGQPEGSIPLKLDNDGVTVAGWVANPGQVKAVIYFGGNAEPVELAVPFYQQLLPDYTIYFIHYRGYGMSGGKPGEKGIFSDSLLVWDHIAQQHEQVSVIGRSLGSGVASYLATQRPVEKLVLITPFDSVANIADDVFPSLPVSWFMRHKFESWRRAADITMDTLCLVAPNDLIVTTLRSDNLIKYFKPQLVTRVNVPNTDHSDIHLSPVFARAMHQFMRADNAIKRSGNKTDGSTSIQESH